MKPMTRSTVLVDTVDGLVSVEVVAEGCTRGLSILLSPQEALELQGRLGAAVLRAEGRVSALGDREAHSHGAKGAA